MNRKSIFTICSKNYLAQALTLKESVLKYEHDVDFFIFLADNVTDEIKDVDVVPLDEQWIPDWKEMAFKYDVIEFNTSIKPFCFKKLFNDGYDKVVYLDPDMFVTDKLDYLWDNLNTYSIILTPHISTLKVDYDGAQTEESILSVGIFNLGFAAIKNNDKGNNIVDWWCVRLQSQCYGWHNLFVDQKWMNFIPCFYPNDLLVSRHSGLNVAIWNLHERELILDNGKYMIKDLETNEVYTLLVFHFSGFDPFNDQVINRRHPRFGVKTYPSFEPIIQEYKKLEYENGYDKYSKLTYSFNYYDNGALIIKLHRRLYRACLKEFDGNPFLSEGAFYRNMKLSGLLIGNRTNGVAYKDVRTEMHKKGRILKVVHLAAKVFKKLFGLDKYLFVINRLATISELENQTFLMQDMERVDKNALFTDRI